VHQPQDYGGEPQPHVHIMFCERKLDGISRPKEQFFKQHYTKIPEKSDYSLFPPFISKIYLFKVQLGNT